MNYKLKGALRRSKANMMFLGLLWLLLVIVVCSSFAHSQFLASRSEVFDIQIFMESFTSSIQHPFATIGNIFTEGSAHIYIASILVSTVVFMFFFFVGLIRSIPKNEYTDFEHGSSDWSQNGEQYEILSKNKGIVLAEDNYLPVDKRGNVNVLVVGRFWFW